MTSPRYPEYRSSKIKWLDEVPVHWDVRRLGQIGRLFKGRGGSKRDASETGVPCVRYGDLYTAHQCFIYGSRSFVSAQNAERYLPVRFGDALFAASGETIEEIGKSAVNLLQSHACCGGDIILFRPSRRVDPRYMGYALDCSLVSSQKAAMGRGVTVMHIYSNQLKHLTIPCPPISEQTNIADFLDDETGRVDIAVEKMGRLVERIRERGASLVARVVTRGLPSRIALQIGVDPNPEFKSSGSSWLGAVPSHWNICRLGAIGKILKGSGGSKVDEVSAGVPCVRYGDLYTTHRFFIRKSRTYVSVESATKYTPIQYGDVLFAGSGETLEDIGRSSVNLMRSEACCGGDVIVFRAECRIDPRYIGYAMDCSPVSAQKAAMGRGITVMHIYRDQLKNLVLPFPPLHEQRLIADFLDGELAKMQAIVSKITTVIERLHEFRTALVTAAVTGAIDVRLTTPNDVEDRSDVL